MCYHLEDFFVFIVGERANYFVFSSRQRTEVFFCEVELVKLKLLVLERTFPHAFWHLLLEIFHARIEWIFLVEVFDELAIVKLWKVAYLEILREHFHVNFEVHLKMRFFNDS